MATVTPISTRARAGKPATARPSRSRPPAVADRQGVKVVRAVTIMGPARPLFDFWRNLKNLARVIRHPVAITRVWDTESHWSVSAPPGDRRVEWDAKIFNEEPDRLIAWRSRAGADIPNAGSVRFEPAPGDEGTEVTVALEYDPPGGRLGALLAKLSGEEPAQQVEEAWRRFKALMEAGELPTTEGQPVGELRRSKLRKQEQKKGRA